MSLDDSKIERMIELFKDAPYIYAIVWNSSLIDNITIT